MDDVVNLNVPFCKCISDTLMNELGHWWNDNEGGKLKYSEKNLSQCHLSITHPTQSGPRLNLGLCGERPATNSLSHRTSLVYA